MQAAIDIGTNSVLLLIGEPMPDGTVRAVEDMARVTRLGEGLAERGSISDEAAERTLAALKEYMDLCDGHRVEGIAAVGTAALREAANAQDFLLVASRTLGLGIEVISARREAALTFRASAHDFGEGIVVIDIGGGSTELVAGPSGEPRGMSIPIGCVNLLEEFIKGDPPAAKEIEALKRHVRRALSEEPRASAYARKGELKAVATAGTATTLMAIHLALEPYDPAAAHGRALTAEDIETIIGELRSKAVDERKRIRGLIPERADVILPGALILREAMDFLGYDDAIVSDRGVKWGLFYEKFC